MSRLGRTAGAGARRSFPHRIGQSGGPSLLPRQAADAGAVAALLRELLVGDERYRRQWQECSRRRSSSLNQAAVARVLALHLWDHGERSDTAVSLPRELKDRVSRALNGT